MDIITLNNVGYYYKTYDDNGAVGKATGVVGVTLSIEEGSFVALVGHNGCGKSTLAKLLNGLLLPSEGEVVVAGMNTADKKNIFEIRKNVGMVFQNPDNQMVASIVEEDVAFGPENLGIPQPEIVERVYGALEQVGMTEYAKRSPHKLSGGQKQRIAIAGALAIRPKIIVFDESTAMLDPQGRREVLDVAHKLNESGMTVILITHFMEEVVGCDEVVVMSGGRVVKTGKPMEIFDDEELLKSVGLEAPRSVTLAKMLVNAGLDVNAHCLDAAELGGEVCRNLTKRQ
ncbi:MAG: energy-coupling factor transporter ATPase [Corallococcus sp.]|nr:energy-coupling factor transporter ATPase [Bacillota bacterium]MCM1533125.1 energy-coupling factor transporter ATPase [Corallococcus sp.]